MSLKPSDIWSNSGEFPSLETIHAYLEGKLDRKAQIAFERWMAESAVFSDAVEGIRVEMEQNKKAIEFLNTEIAHAAEQRPKVVSLINYRNLAIAASFALLITAGGVYFLNVVKKKSQETAIASETTPAGASDSLNFGFANSSSGFGISSPTSSREPIALLSTKSAPQTYSTKAASEKPVESTLAQISPAGNAVGAVTSSDLSGDKSVTAPEAESFKMEEPPSGIAQSEDLVNQLLAMDISKSLEESNELPAPRSDNSADQKEYVSKSKIKESKRSSAAPAISDVKKEDRIDFPEGIKLLITSKKTEMALAQLDKIILLNDDRKQEALWLKSIALIQQNEISAAKTILLGLSITSGPFQSKATQVLGQLK